MKRYFAAVAGAVAFCVLALVGYGSYLNLRSETVIRKTMEQRSLNVRAIKVRQRDLLPQYEMKLFNVYTENVADAVAHAEGHIVQTYAENGQHVEKGQAICELESGVAVRAPLEGDLLLTYKSQGDFVKMGDSVALIGDFSTMNLLTTVDEPQIQAFLPLDAPHKIVFENREMTNIYDNAFKGTKERIPRFSLRPVAITPPLEIPSFRRKIVWEIDNHTGLLERGMYETATIYTLKEKRALAIPKNALLPGDETWVFVSDAGILRLCRVQTGVEDEIYVEIVDGLSDGEIVVISGREGLEPGIRVDTSITEEGR